ncbi:LOW QUALITY PROTEIN: hypothetical protein PoB_005257800 [Plakobranchus ocellatus]|uniref:Uncharacterized protein n=1 Tax=Plakobranchus ocellatus TaxID=259542 RepID=A0AAV4C3T4_9GAST|nr:LOW QUALITY PROTEIN: hypothetical protein PoB_005257800 [Plakobranchus ocellatus]
MFLILAKLLSADKRLYLLATPPGDTSLYRYKAVSKCDISVLDASLLTYGCISPRYLKATCFSADRRLYIHETPPGYTPICLQIAVYPCDTSRLQASLPTDGCISVRHLQATRLSACRLLYIRATPPGYTPICLQIAVYPCDTSRLQASLPTDGCISVRHLQMAVSPRETPRLYVSLPNLPATPQGYMTLSADALLYLLVTPLSYQTGVSPLTPLGCTSLCRKTAVSPVDTPKLYTSLPTDCCVSPPHLHATPPPGYTPLPKDGCISPHHLWLHSTLPTDGCISPRHLQATHHCCIPQETSRLDATAVSHATPSGYTLHASLPTDGCISTRYLQATRLSSNRWLYLHAISPDYTSLFLPTDGCISTRYLQTTRLSSNRWLYLHATPSDYTPVFQQMAVSPRDISKLHAFLPTDGCISTRYLQATSLSSNRWLYLHLTPSDYTPLFQQMAVSPRDISRLHASLLTDGCISTRYLQATRLSSDRWLYLHAISPDYTSLFQQIALSSRDTFRLHASLPTDGCISTRHLQTTRLSSNRRGVSPRDISRLDASLPTDGCISTRRLRVETRGIFLTT